MQVGLDDVDALITRWSMNNRDLRDEDYRGPIVGTGEVAFSVHPDIESLELITWNSTQLAVDLSPVIGDITTHLNHVLDLLPIDRKEWQQLSEAKARQVLSGVKRGRPKTKESEWLRRAIIAAEAPAGTHRQALIKAYHPDAQASTIEKWIDRMKQGSNNPDALRPALLWHEGEGNKTIVHLTDHARKRIKELGINE